MNKENSFRDYISCAEFLISEGYTDTKRLIGYGQSAGGMVLGTVMNRRPELFHAVIFDRPFLDVLNNMMDPSIPLTVTHYEEWGNPRERETYHYMKNYCPYQGVKKQAYPKMIFMAGAKDFNTPIWQTAKFVSKIRANNTSNNPIVFLTDFDSGHYGSFVNEDNIRRLAQMYGFIYDGVE